MWSFLSSPCRLHMILALTAVGVSSITVTGIELLGGRLNTTNNDVQGILNLALDAADMRESNDINQKLDIYQNGANSAFGQTMTLQSLSLTASTEMLLNPMYHLFRNEFLVLGSETEGEEIGMFDGASINQYADTVVKDLFELSIRNIETEATLIMSVWMAAANELFKMLYSCKAGETTAALAALDRAMAYYIGEGQIFGSNERGHLLYNHAEIAGAHFDQDDEESIINSQVIGLFTTLQADLNGDTCGNLSGYSIIRDDVKRLVSLFTVPLVQMLIHHIMNVENEGGSDFVELYALSILPRVAACNPKLYMEELQLDVLQELVTDNKLSAISVLQQSYSCLHVTCEDVGQYMGGTVSCSSEDESNEYKLTGYTTSRADARTKSYLDRDLYQMDIFMKFNAYDVTTDWYEYGWNSVYTFRELARNRVIPTPDNSLYYTYQEFYEHVEFAHDTITAALERTATFSNASPQQVRSMVMSTLKYVVVYLSVVSSVQFAVTECLDGKQGSALQFWDAAVMFYVGSMEGKSDVGNLDVGQSLFAAANRLCVDFDTCTKEINSDGAEVNVARVNNEIMDAFINGETLIETGSCDIADTVVDEMIIPALLTSLLQGTARYASINQNLPAGTENQSLSLGHAYSTSILPLIETANPTSASSIRLAMNFQLTTKPVMNGFRSVADAIRQALPSMKYEVGCDEIGVLKDELAYGDFCSGVIVDNDTSYTSPEAAPIGISPVANPTQPISVPVPVPVPIPVPASPVSLPISAPTPAGRADIAFGRYEFTSLEIADGDASFSLDIRDMFAAASTDAARSIYEDGANVASSSFGYSNLKSLSKHANDFMKDDPMFNIYKYAFYAEEWFDDGEEYLFAYADEMIQEIFDKGLENELAAEGTVVVNAWMAIVHRLYSAVRVCSGGNSGAGMIDSAVALWIGKEQAEGRFGNGWMMYSIGQASYERFGFAEKEAPVNTLLMKLMAECQAIAATCDKPDIETAAASLQLRQKVQATIRVLTKPLVQSLLFHMTTPDSKNMVELYSAAVIPQASACDPALEDALQRALFHGYNSTASITKDVTGYLASFMQCIRVTCDDLQVSDENVSQELSNLVRNICAILEEKKSVSLVGYKPIQDVSETARLDLDARTIQVLLASKAYTAARDVYEHGWNSFASKTGEKILSIQQVATSKDRERLAQYEQFEDYYGSGDNYNALILNVLEGGYPDASRTQQMELVRRTIQSMVMYIGVQTKLQSAVDNCRKGIAAKTFAQLDWDTAVAMYVGSIEGPISGGHPYRKGLFSYSLGNEMCDQFETCEASGESLANQELMFYFANGRDGLQDSECDHVQRTVTWNIIPKMSISLIQGVLSYALENENLESGEDEDSVAEGHVLAAAVLPFVNAANETSAATLKRNFKFNVHAEPVPDGAEKVFEALTYVLRRMGVDCKDIGTPIENEDLSVCDSEVIAPHADTPTNLGDDLYVTTTYVEDRANIALDIRDMEQALTEGSREIAKLVYQNGKNSEEYDENGQYAGLRSLKSFSVASTIEMSEEPLFNIFLYALRDEHGHVLGKQARVYADTIVEKTFDLTTSSAKLLPAEAAVVLNLWMYVVHLLQRTLENCRLKHVRDPDGVHSIDVAVANWIGDGNFTGEMDRGHVLYALAEENDMHFTHDDVEITGQSGTNTNILRLFNQAKNELNTPAACSDNPTTFTRLTQTFNKIVTVMAIPLVQGLIHNLLVNDRDRVSVYAHAFVPLVATCSPDKFEYLKGKLLGSADFNVVEVEDIIDMIRSTLPCLGLKCDSIGLHSSERREERMFCTDPDSLVPLAGYMPAHDVRDYARFDLDILQLDILMKMRAYTAASNVYQYGKHVDNPNNYGGSLSLSQLATTSDRTIVPTFDSFSRYYETDNYADDIIQAAVAGWDSSRTDTERHLVVLRSSQVMVLYFASLQLVYEAVSDCAGDAERAGLSWDRAAAMMIGHLEGSENGGSKDGFMYYDLAQEYCTEFGTCVDNGVEFTVNNELVTLLYSGRGALQGNNCKALRKQADELASLILVPVIQGALSAALRISSSSGGSDSIAAQAEGYVFSSALLPLVRDANLDAATTISNNLGFDAVPNKKAAAEVFAALAKSYKKLGVDCHMVGTAGGFDACSGAEATLKKKHVGIIIGLILVVLSCGLGLYVRSRRKNHEKLPENNPRFVVKSTGEMNHSMDLLQKAFSRRSGPPKETDALTSNMQDASAPADDEDFHDSRDSRPNLSKEVDII